MNQVPSPQIPDQTFIITTIQSFIEPLLLNSLKYQKKEIIFITTVCPYAIETFTRFSKMFNIKGIAFPLEGGICNQWKSFTLAERGIKKGITHIDEKNSKILLNLLNIRSNFLFKNRT